MVDSQHIGSACALTFMAKLRVRDAIHWLREHENLGVEQAIEWLEKALTHVGSAHERLDGIGITRWSKHRNCHNCGSPRSQFGDIRCPEDCD
jgi:hypothetical protein